MDVGANHRVAWNDVQSTIDIKKGGKILAISLNDDQTNNHFGGRPIFGIVTSFIRCSDVPGSNMEMPTPCLNIPIPPPASLPSASAAPPVPPPTAAPVSPPSPAPAPPAISANNTVQSLANFTGSSPPSPPANITTSRPPSAPNVTGKSPFDILGGG